LIRGLYASATGMLALMDKQDVIANNLANVSTAGFKKDYASIQSFPEALVFAQERQSGSRYTQKPVGLLSSGASISEIGFINSNGSLKQTGGKYDVALVSDGFFAVQTPSGEMYTRNGNFAMDSLGRLIDQNGNLVLGEKGPIIVNGNELSVEESGDVYVDGVLADTLKVRSFSKGELEKAGSNLFKANAQGVRSGDVTIRQGYLEGSNVDATSEMVEMIATMRSFEANQRILKAQDEILGRAVNDVGRIA